MSLQRMNNIPRTGTLHLLPCDKKRGIVTIRIPGNPVIFYRGRQEILQIVLSDLEISQMLDVLDENEIPHKWIENPVILHQRTGGCGRCPFYHQGFNESCSLRWQDPPKVAEDLREYVDACEDLENPAKIL